MWKKNADLREILPVKKPEANNSRPLILPSACAFLCIVSGNWEQDIYQEMAKGDAMAGVGVRSC